MSLEVKQTDAGIDEETSQSNGPPSHASKADTRERTPPNPPIETRLHAKEPRDPSTANPSQALGTLARSTSAQTNPLAHKNASGSCYLQIHGLTVHVESSVGGIGDQPVVIPKG